MVEYKIVYSLRHHYVDSLRADSSVSVYLERYACVSKETKDLVYFPDGYYWEEHLQRV